MLLLSTRTGEHTVGRTDTARLREELRRAEQDVRRLEEQGASRRDLARYHLDRLRDAALGPPPGRRP